MCFVCFPRNFIKHSLRNNSSVLIKSNAAIQVSYMSSSKQYSEFEPLSNNEFDVSKSLKSYYKIDFQAITQRNAKKIKALEILMMKMELQMQQGIQLPKIISTDHWRTLLTLSEDEKIDFIRYRLNLETLVASQERERKEAINYFESNISCNGLFNSTILDRIPCLYDSNSLQAMRYGPNIVIDCSLEKSIPRHLIWDTAFYMFWAWLKNRIFTNPSHIIYCNLNPNGEFFSLIMEIFKETNHDSTSFTWTSKSYLDLFPKEDLIYLSPDSRYTMEKYNGKKVYIIGGLPNCLPNPITYKKSKIEEIQTAKLPIDEYVHSGKGPKTLTIFNCVNVLNDLKEGCSWNIAFRHLPKQSWVQRRMDENKVKPFRKHKPPTKLIQLQNRQLFLDRFRTGG